MKKLLKLGSLLVLIALIFSACGKKEKSATTGWNYNDQKWGGFEKKDYAGQVNGPNLVLVQGGTFSMGMTDQDVIFELTTLNVRHFFIDCDEFLPPVCSGRIKIIIKNLLEHCWKK